MRAKSRLAAGTAVALALAIAAPASALTWKGYDWRVTNGGMAGVANGDPANVSVDANGYLHLKIVKNGNTWTASELFTTQKLGFGTYQWQIEGPIDVFDKQVVLGLFPYGPEAGIGSDGTNEIDIEFSRWGNANGVNADFTDYPNSGTTIGETSFNFSLGGGTSSTARFTWTNASIESAVLKGHQPIASEAELIKKWKYAPPSPDTNIPQQALPLGINLWCFDAPPTDGQNVEIVLQDFQFIKEGDPPSGGGGSAGGGAGGGGGTASGGNSTAVSGTGGTPGVGVAGGNTMAGETASEGASAGRTTAGGSGGTAPFGAGASNGGTTAGAAETAPAAGTAPASAGNAGNAADGAGAGSGCACQLAGAQRSGTALLGLAGLLVFGVRRRRFLTRPARGAQDPFTKKRTSSSQTS